MRHRQEAPASCTAELEALSTETTLDWALGTAPLDTLILATADHETGGLMVLDNNGAGEYPTVWWVADGHTGTNAPSTDGDRTASLSPR